MSPYVQDKLDAQQTPLYDTYQIAGSTAVPNKITFFDTRTTASSGLQVTNMPRAGMLPAPESFTVFGMAFGPIGCDEADILSIYRRYCAQLIVGTKVYLEAPMEFFPAGGGLAGMYGTMTAAATNKQFTNGIPSAQAVQALAPEYGVSIPSSAPFSVQLVGDAGFTSAATIFLRCYLLGIREKGVQ